MLPVAGSALTMAKLVHYSGIVQGVGFRATTARIARSHTVRGWVRNLPDGRVELLVDGNAEDVESFLADVRRRMADYIEDETGAEHRLDESIEGF
jgi:acylphosphatase